MTNAETLLGAPPRGLLLALAAIRQSADLPCQVENVDLPEYLIDFVPASDRSELFGYLNELLAAPDLTDANLRALFTRLGAGAWYSESKSARDLFAGLQRALRNEVNNHG